jgi:hypothetical protein
MPARGDLRHGRQRIGTELRGGIGSRRVTDVDQPVRRSLQQFRCRLGGADVHAAVDQRGIDADDLQREAAYQLDRQRGLARGGRPYQENGRREFVLRHRKNHLVQRRKGAKTIITTEDTELTEEINAVHRKNSGNGTITIRFEKFADAIRSYRCIKHLEGRRHARTA